MKSIVINEAQEPKTISANSLVPALSAGGEQSWVPEDETQLQQKTATRNGKVKPDSGFYGLSEVDVYVKGTYPSPGDTTPIKPGENEQMENATVFMVAIAGGVELNFVPTITIGNAEREGVISVVDFSNAKIECLNIDGLKNFENTNNLGGSFFKQTATGTRINSNSNVSIIQTRNTISYIQSGKFENYSGTSFYIGNGSAESWWKVSNVSYSSGDTYCFVITFYTNNAAT